MKIQCRVCGGALEVPDVPDSISDELRALLTRVASSIVHDGCIGNSGQPLDMEPDKIAKKAMYSYQVVIPVCAQGTEVQKLPNQEAYEEAMQWKVGTGIGLYLFGDTGTGKTRTAWQIMAREHSDNGKVLGFIHKDWITEWCRSHTPESAARLCELCRTCDVFLLDDMVPDHFPAGSRSREATSALLDVLLVRCANGYPVIVTSKEPPTAIGSAMSEINPGLRDVLLKKFVHVMF